MKPITTTATALAGVLMAAALLAQPAEAGGFGKKYRSHHHHHHYYHGHGGDRGFGHRRIVRRFHGHRHSSFRFLYIAPPRQVTVVRPYVPPQTVYVTPPVRQVAPTACREYTKTVVINGQTVPAYGRACLQPDGSWQMVPVN